MVHTHYDIAPELAEKVFDPKFWQELAPKFALSDQVDDFALEFSGNEQNKLREKLVREGYIHVQQPGLNSPIVEMTELFTELVKMGLPPVFAFVYNELWTVNSQLRNLLQTSLGGDFAMLPDFWCWRVAPGEAGWSPHRDKTHGSLFEDKTPKSVTVWIPITQAHPLNGCMYVVPADRDGFYGKDGAQGFQASIPDIRALPGEAGDVYVWTQHIFHWGAQAAEEHDLPPRMSIAFEYQLKEVPAFNEPLLDPLRLPTFEERLALIAKQTLQYQHMYGFHDKLVAIANDIRNKHGALLENIGIETQAA